MWWILVLLGLGALLVLVSAGAWFLFRPSPKRRDDAFDEDFAPRAPELPSPGLTLPISPPEPEEPVPPASAPDAPVASAEPDPPAPESAAELAPSVAPPIEEEHPAPEPAPAPAPAEAPVDPAPPEPEPAPVFEMIQKARISGVELILWAQSVRFGGEECLGFTTDGFAAHGKPDLALYMPMPADDVSEVIKAGLKFFSYVSLKLDERSAPVAADDVLAFPGKIGVLDFGGFLAIAANEPEPVPMGPHVVLLAVPRPRMTNDPAVLRSILGVNEAGPYRSEPEAAPLV